ncbi:MAG: hypothetical protein Q8O19_07590, partial [Rectinemataceae bacterium]|nr:hypothetical protein [Rectinemataceae bacterium]
VDDVILSGGDPLYAPESCMQIIKGLRTIDSIKVVRIGTRLPIHAPKSIKAPRIAALLEEFRKSAGSFMTYVLVHVNHSDELDEDVIEALRILRSYNFPVLSQSVFLKDVNDNETVLETLFKKLYYLGVVPYYIYRCDYVKGLERFVCDMEDERRIMTSLRERMSGIALPTYIADVNGIGKIPVPLGFWDMTDLKYCRDYTGATIQL